MHPIKITFLLAICLPSFLSAQTLTEGKKALENEKFREAKKIFTFLIAQSPADAELYYHYGNLNYMLGAKDTAHLAFNKGISANPQLAFNYIGIGKILLDENKSAEAKINFDKALSFSKSKDPKVITLIAEAYSTTSGQKDISKAIELLHKVLEVDYKNFDAHLLLGDIYLEQPNSGGKAMSSYERAVEANPSLAKGYLKIGELFTQARNYEEAVRAFQNGIKADSTFALIHRAFAELEYKAKHYDVASDEYKKYLANTESNVQNLTRYASFLFLNKDYPNTITVVNQVLQMDSSSAILKRLIAYSYYEQGKFPEGLSFIEKFFKEIDAKKIIASDYEYYGRLLAKTGSDSLAIINLQKAISIDTTKIELYGDLGQLSYQRKNYKDAARFYELKLQKTKPSSAEYFQLGRSYYYNGDYFNADSAFIKVTELSPKSHLGFMWRGRATSNIDSTETKESVKPFYDKTVELIMASDTVKYKKDLLEAYQFLGYYYVQKDENANAKTYYKKMLELDPMNKDAKKVLEALKQQ